MATALLTLEIQNEHFAGHIIQNTCVLNRYQTIFSIAMKQYAVPPGICSLLSQFVETYGDCQALSMLPH